MDDEGRIALPQSEIAPHMGIGERQTRAAISALVSAGYLKRTRRGTVGKGRAPDLLTANFERSADSGELSPPPRETGEKPPLLPVSEKKPHNSDSGGKSPPPSAKSRSADNAVKLPVSEIEDAEFVDNPQAACIGTGARAETLNLNTSCSEVPPETPEQLNTPTRTPARGGGSLVQRVCDLVGSPWLDPCKSSLLTTRPGRLARWAAQMDVESELIPILKAKIACNGTEPIVSWNYFEFAVNDFLKDKQQQAQEVANDHAASAPRHAAGATTVRRKYDPVFDAIYREEPVAPPIDYGRVDFSSGK